MSVTLLVTITIIGIVMVVRNYQTPESPPTNMAFVKTFDAPQGVWLYIVEEDNTRPIQFWHTTGGRYLVLHKSGNLTYTTAEDIGHISIMIEQYERQQHQQSVRVPQTCQLH